MNTNTTVSEEFDNPLDYVIGELHFQGHANAEAFRQRIDLPTYDTNNLNVRLFLVGRALRECILDNIEGDTMSLRYFIQDTAPAIEWKKLITKNVIPALVKHNAI